MKWLPFLLVIMICCRSRPGVGEEVRKPERASVYSYNDTVTMPSDFDQWADSGYFKGYVATEINDLQTNDTTQLAAFLSGIISKKDIVLLGNKTFSHSVFIDQAKELRMDTLRNNQATIISRYKFGKAEEQRITINGVVVKDYIWKGVDSLEEDAIDLDESSFRYFSFKGKEYYYIRARRFYSSGTSSGNVCYHLIYSLKHRTLNYFYTCRFEQMLFGDVNGDDDLDFLDFNNSDFCTTVPNSYHVTIQLYSCNKQGNFVLKKDGKNNPFYIEGNTGENFTQDSFIVKKSYWPFHLK